MDTHQCYTPPDVMATRTKQTAFRLEPDILDGLQRIKTRDGVPVSEQVRRALWAWIEARDVKADRPRAATRKRS